MNTLAFIPSPSAGEIHLGPVPLRGYALCIIVGVFFAVWLGGRRWVARGGQPGTVADIAVWAVPFGLIGGRLYHVITDYQLYFGEGRNWVDAFRVWDGGLGIWGAVAIGAVGAWIGCRRRGIPLPAWADALAPGLAAAQAIGRWGNWFNQELYGRATDVPWAVKIDPENRPVDSPDLATYHPTFLYESLWCIGAALLVIWADRRFRMGHGRVFALYVALYTVGRFWIEYMRIDDAHEVWGLRLNNWTSVVVFLGAVAYMVISQRRSPGREEVVEPRAPGDDDGGAGGSGGGSGKDAGAAVSMKKAKDGSGTDESAADGSESDDPEPADPADAADDGGSTAEASAQQGSSKKS
ncbi:prolipoprotein diacylglyceryl transferase [Streptomyces armeniacus]|uniref:Phosphatidylglycerol--prolipoprotein diacylglyceryl transferase n=1 Tax=Streptomyces armeniacus TaxID=83291 RepID=A0A345XWK0_9ACTN|nr:prolipoprotein diacylglyceryl transferase [Streptomyces armeniacus]AXK36016.1 prolipoprotein diacylglyceryl transferase [Streptomyces armeniacus]